MRRWHGSAPEEGAARAIAEIDLRAEAAADRMDAALRALDRLPEGGVLKAIVGSDERALVDALSARALVRSVEHDGIWTLELRALGSEDALDLRELEPPEPLERILAASARLAPGGSLLARVPRFPRMLLPQLERRALSWEIYEERDGTALVCVRRPR